MIADEFHKNSERGTRFSIKHRAMRDMPMYQKLGFIVRRIKDNKKRRRPSYVA
jgi:hypothetical protein